jgi:hypothetical protein
MNHSVALAGVTSSVIWSYMYNQLDEMRAVLLRVKELCNRMSVRRPAVLIKTFPRNIF